MLRIKIINKEKRYGYLDTQSSSNIPPRARAESPGGKTHVTGGKSLRDSPASLANPVDEITLTSFNRFYNNINMYQ